MATYVLKFEGIQPLDRALHVERGGRYVLGRAGDADFQLPEGDHRISRHHASVEGEVGGIRILDLGSSNGTFVNGARIDTAVLRPGDWVRLGNTVLVVEEMDPSMPKVFGIFRPKRDDRPDWATELDILRGLQELTCTSCGSPWPDGVAGRPGCGVCAPGRPFGDSEPRTLGPFDLLQVIGEGPRAIVYEARHRGTGIRSALKWYPTPGWTDDERAAWYRRAHDRIKLPPHPKLARAFEPAWDRATGDLGVSMEWLRAGNCRKLAGPRSALAPTLLLGADLFHALAYLHAQAVVHGDVKPDNLLLTWFQGDRWCGALADFLGAEPPLRPRPPSASSSQAAPHRLDASAFAAPELADPALAPSQATDTYSAAATVYYLLTGLLPSTDSGAGPAASRSLASLAHRRKDAPDDLVELLDSALHPDPAARSPFRAGEIRVRLQQIAKRLPGA